MNAATGASQRWSDSQLDRLRQTQDPPADSVIAELFATGQVNSVNELMKTLVENDEVPPEALPAAVRSYLAASEVLPDWADPRRIEMGERLFWQYGPAMIGILHCYSLPYCYAAHKGVQVLALTSRLHTNATRRIIETAQMIVDVMRPGGLTSIGSGIRSAQKVRLMHAGVRFQIGHYAGWKSEWDKPINQEDMALTLLTFSWNMIDGLRKLGYQISSEEAEAYIHCWNVIGHVLGILPEARAKDYEDAAALLACVEERQFAACEEGQMMSRALIEMMQQIVPGNLFDRVPGRMTRFFLGDRTADILAIEGGRADELLLLPVRALARVRSDAIHKSEALAKIHEVFARALIQGLLLAARGGKRIPFSIPTELLQAWGINWVA